MPPVSDYDRFWSKVTPEPMSGCWLWGAYAHSSGHGKFGIGSVVHGAHRVAWCWEHGPIPDDYDVHHVCHNPSCVNVDHLQALPMAEHRVLTVEQDGLMGIAAVHATKTTCPKGHEFDGHNGKQRTCSTCGKEQKRRHAQKKRRERGALPHPRDRTQCPRGHPYDGHNGAQRTCSTCHNAAQRQRRAG